MAAHNAAVLIVSLGLDTYGQDPILQEGGYFVPKLGENARTWLRGLLGCPLAAEVQGGLGPAA